LFCWLSIAAAQSELPPEVLQLSRIKRHMQQRLEQVPNYTCLQTVERLVRVHRAAKFKPLDTVRVEVAQVDGKEMFAWPGKEFDQANPSAFTNGGVMANGLFSLHARSLFISDVAMFTYAGEEEVEGRKLVRYDYSVPLMRSGYRIVVASQSATVGYHGSFWADAQTLDVDRFRVVAENIPPVLGLLDAGVDIEFQDATIGSTDALLPKRADLMLTGFDGGQRRNIVSFSRCRQYGSDSVLSFGVPDGAPAAPIAETPEKPKKE
jgi:hypothetical protein